MKTLLLATILATSALSQTAFRVEVTGKGPAMILIPGLASSGATWDTTVARYKDRYECHVLTLAGFAGVPRVEPGAEGALATVREQLAAYVREKKLGKPVVVGHSLGGTIAMDFAGRYPELTAKLVIVDTYPFTMGLDPNMTPGQAKAISGQIRTGMSGMGQEAYAKGAEGGGNTDYMTMSEANQQILRKWAAASDVRSVAETLSEMLGGDWRADVAKITAPTWVLAAWKGSENRGATHDVVAKNMAAQYANLKGVQIRVTDNARHFIMWDDAAWFFGQLDEVLGKAK